jgi:hypothetical protein
VTRTSRPGLNVRVGARLAPPERAGKMAALARRFERGGNASAEAAWQRSDGF